MSTVLSSNSTFTLPEASEIRDPDGSRRYGSLDTLRRRRRAGDLRADKQGTTYVVHRADLEAMRERTKAEKAYAELRAAAQRAAKLAPPISKERRAEIAAILRAA